MLARAFLTSLFSFVWTLACSFIAILSLIFSPSGALYLGIARRWAELTFFVGGIEVRKSVSPGIDEGQSYLYLSNHESLTDILALYATLPQKVVMVAKRSLLFLPLFGWGMWLAGFVFIDRKNRQAAYRSLETAGQRLKKGRSVLVFPEGTRSTDAELLPFKRGGFLLAQAARIPVVPVGVAGTRAILPRNHCCIFPGRVAVCVGAPIPPPEKGAPLGPYIAMLRDEIARLRKEAEALSGSASPIF